MLLLFGGRPDRLEVIFNERPVFPWNAVLIQEILLSGTQIRFNVSIVEFGAFLLAHFLDVFLLPLILHAFDAFLLELDIQSCRRSLTGSIAAALAGRHQPVAFAVARHRRACLSVHACLIGGIAFGSCPKLQALCLIILLLPALSPLAFPILGLALPPLSSPALLISCLL